MCTLWLRRDDGPEVTGTSRIYNSFKRDRN